MPATEASALRAACSACQGKHRAHTCGITQADRDKQHAAKLVAQQSEHGGCPACQGRHKAHTCSKRKARAADEVDAKRQQVVQPDDSVSWAALPPVGARNWSAEEERALILYVEQHSDVERGRIDWSDVEIFIPSRSQRACEKHRRAMDALKAADNDATETEGRLAQDPAPPADPSLREVTCPSLAHTAP
jgi:hypothetical protein